MVVQTNVWQHKNFTPYSEEYIDEVSKRQNRWWWDKDILGWNTFWDPSKLKRWDITDTNDYIYDWQNWLRIWTPAATAVVNQINSSWMYWNPNNNNNTPEETKEEPKKETPKKNTRRKFVPTYVAPDWKTYTGMTQDQFNQRMQEYQMEDAIIADNKARQQALRSQTVGDGDVTRDQIFKDALNKFAENPDGFTADQRTMLYNVGKQLWYYNDTMLDDQAQTPAQTAPSVTPQNTANTTVAGTQANDQQQFQAQSQSNNNVKQWGWSNFIWSI